MSSALAWCAGPAAVSGYVPIPPAPRAPLPPEALWLALARRALGAGRHDEALRLFERALLHAPGLALAHLGRAVCLGQMGREEPAGAAMGAALDAARGQEEVLYQLARMCAAEGHAHVGAPLLAEAVRAMPAFEERAAADPLFADHPAYLAALGRL